jgi:hypothetical protein
MKPNAGDLRDVCLRPHGTKQIIKYACSDVAGIYQTFDSNPFVC